MAARQRLEQQLCNVQGHADGLRTEVETVQLRSNEAQKQLQARLKAKCAELDAALDERYQLQV